MVGLGVLFNFYNNCCFTLFIKKKKRLQKRKAKLERIIYERTAELMKEKERADDLLANLLPKDTADELKKTGKATSQSITL